MEKHKSVSKAVQQTSTAQPITTGDSLIVLSHWRTVTSSDTLNISYSALVKYSPRCTALTNGLDADESSEKIGAGGSGTAFKAQNIPIQCCGIGGRLPDTWIFPFHGPTYLLRLHLLEFSPGRRSGWSSQENFVYTCWIDAALSQFSF